MSDISQPNEPRVGAKKSSRKSKRGRRIMVLILVALAILLITVTFFLVRILIPANDAASPAEANGLEWVRSIYGVGPAKSQQLQLPSSVAIAPDGTIWVTDPTTARVLAFNPDGSFKSVLRGAANDPLILPTDVTVDEQGRIYVLETTQDEMHVLTANNQQLLVKKVQEPTSVGVSGDRIIVGAKAGFAIMDKQGNVLKVVGTMGKGEDQFDTVNGIVIAADGTFYTVDTFNNRLGHYDRDGNQIWISSLGKAGNQQALASPTGDKKSMESSAALQLPSGMTLDGNDRLIIVDPFDFSLTAVSPKDGKLIKKYGEYGTEDGKLAYPSGISYDPTRDWFAVADSANNRVQIVRLPDSGGSALAAAARSLTGPIRACLFPLILILIAIIIWVVMRRRKNRKKTSQSAQSSLLEAGESDSVTPSERGDSVE
jgi:sugar lactone lactonase YvrE/cbb3-type cytochrome oxidase subunit 3